MDEFLDAAERVSRGGSALDPLVVGRLLGPDSAEHGLSELSEREGEVLSLMAEGLTNTGIAKRLYLSERTVEATFGTFCSSSTFRTRRTAIAASSPC